MLDEQQIRIYTVCTGLSVPILSVIMVDLQNSVTVLDIQTVKENPEIFFLGPSFTMTGHLFKFFKHLLYVRAAYITAVKVCVIHLYHTVHK